MSELLRTYLIEEEDRREQPYYDSKGFVTFGVGHLCDPRKRCPLPGSIIDAVLEIDMGAAVGLAARIPGYAALNEVRRAVLAAMVFQLGFEPFDGDGVKDFTRFLAALAIADYVLAAQEMLDSKWAREDSPARARRAARMMHSGQWEPRP